MAPREDCILLLQGGGALGSYQAGAYEALAAHGFAVDWVAGISIGAINAAIIAGNPPQMRVARLEQFWHLASSGVSGAPMLDASLARMFSNEVSAAYVAANGAPGFFSPRVVPPTFFSSGQPQALSYYDTAPLRETLERLIDFDLLNSGRVRISVGAVDVRTGNFAYFDSAQRKLDVRHIMASGALPPGFTPVEIDGEYYWDGGLVSNTPLQYVTDMIGLRHDATIFQIDLFPARGPMPRTLYEAVGREKDIRYSSRTRLNTDVAKEKLERRKALRDLLARLPDEFQQDPQVRGLRERYESTPAIALVHLIYRDRNYETQAKDYLFSRQAILDHWEGGKRDVDKTFHHPAWHDCAARREPGIAVYDLTGEQS